MSKCKPQANSLAIPNPTMSLQRPLLIMYNLVLILDDISGLAQKHKECPHPHPNQDSQ